MTVELFLENSYLTECEAKILQIDGDKVILDRTVCYPTGGGQEHDTGVILQDGNAFEIVNVKRENGKIIHYVSRAEQLKTGDAVVRIDWERRYGLMRHHSLLHVLAAVVNRKYGSLCTGNQIYPDRARIDFTGLHDLKEEELAAIIEETNAHIARNYPITSRYITREEVDRAPEFIKTVVNLLPPSVTRVRLVAIGDIDEQACGGTHVKETGEIGQLVVTKVKSKGKDSKRLEVAAIPGNPAERVGTSYEPSHK